MSEQFQVCDLNGTETFKLTKTFKSFPDTNKNMLNIIKRSDNHNYIPSKVVDNVTDTYMKAFRPKEIYTPKYQRVYSCYSLYFEYL